MLGKTAIQMISVPTEKGSVMGMYESPIKIIYGKMQTQMEGDILKAVTNVDIHVDKGELLLALQYDRKQYECGFIDGHMTAQKELIRCKDCRHFIEGEPYDPCECMKWKNKYGVTYTTPEGYCHKAERKDNG